MYGQQFGPPQLVHGSAPGPFITTTGGGPVTSAAGLPYPSRYSAPGGAAATPLSVQQQQEHAQSLAKGRTRRQPTRAAAAKVWSCFVAVLAVAGFCCDMDRSLIAQEHLRTGVDLRPASKATKMGTA